MTLLPIPRPAVPQPSQTAPSLTGLIQHAAALAGVPSGPVAALFDRLTAAWPRVLPGAGQAGGQRPSTLTPNGVPLELAVTLGEASSFRYIVDPGDFQRPGPERALGSAATARALLPPGEARDVHDALVAAALQRPWLEARTARFGVWLAPQHWPEGRQVLRVYYNLAPLRSAVGGPLRAVIERLAPALPFAPPPLTALVPAGLCLAMLGMEVQGTEPVKFKWYFRTCRAVSPAELGRVLDRAGLPDRRPALTAFLRALLGGRLVVPERQGVLYVSGDRAGRPGVNVYLTAALLGETDVAVARRVRAALAALGLDGQAYEALWTRVQADSASGSGPARLHHTLTGLGLGAQGARVNQYLCPALPAGRVLRPGTDAA